MNIKNAEIAKKYATAFLNLYIDKIDERSFLNIITAFEYLEFNSNILSFFSLPNLSLSAKNKNIDILLSKFDLPFEFKKLFNLLLKHNRIGLFLDILREIIWLYQQKTAHICFDIRSGTELQEPDLLLIRKLLEKKLGKKVIESYKIDKSLIAGIRLQSDNFLWENSIGKKLRDMKSLVI